MWTDDQGVTHFSDMPPADQAAKRLNIPGSCPLREQILELPLESRVNLGMWLYLGAPLQTDDPNGRQYYGWDEEPSNSWRRKQAGQARKLHDIKNKIIFEARQCALGGTQACSCSRSLFHDPPRGFAPEGYVPPSEAQVKALGNHLANQALPQP